MTIDQQKEVLAMLAAGHTYEYVMKTTSLRSTQIARIRNRALAFKDGLVDTQFIGQPMNLSGGAYMPTPEEIRQRCAIVRRRYKEDTELEPVEIQVVPIQELGIWRRGGERVTW